MLSYLLQCIAITFWFKSLIFVFVIFIRHEYHIPREKLVGVYVSNREDLTNEYPTTMADV